MNTSEIKTYEEWNALNIEGKRDYYLSILPKMKFQYIDDEVKNLQCWDGAKWYTQFQNYQNWKSCFYRIKPEPEYVPYTRESFAPYADCWFRCEDNDIYFKIEAIFITGVTTHYANHTWQEFFEKFLRIDLATGETFPAGVEVQP